MLIYLCDKLWKKHDCVNTGKHVMLISTTVINFYEIHQVYVYLLQEIEKHPFFMTKEPQPGEELHPLLEGLQQLKYDDSNDPEGV